ncbi:MAG: acyl-CoA dehydrogenase family protein, partial [Panacagrimonas sp.]
MILSHEHKELYRTARKFVQDELNPHVAEWERDGIW